MWPFYYLAHPFNLTRVLKDCQCKFVLEIFLPIICKTDSLVSNFPELNEIVGTVLTNKKYDGKHFV